jgi:hypothetical protein
MKMRKLMFALAIAAGAWAFFGSAAFAAADFASSAPGDAVGYYEFPYSKENAEKIQQSNLYKMLASEELSGMMQELIKMIPEKDAKENPFAKAGLEWSDLLALKYGGFAMSFNYKPPEKNAAGPEPAPDAEPEPAPEAEPEPAPEAGPGPAAEAVPGPQANEAPGIALYFDRANPEIKALTDKLTKIADQFSQGEDAVLEKGEEQIEGMQATVYKIKDGSPGMEEIIVFESGDMLVAVSERGLAIKIIKCMSQQGADSLAKNELYTKAVGKLDPRHMATFFLNTAPLLALAKADETTPPEVMNVLHLDSVQAVVYGMWADADGTFGHLYVYCPDGKFALLKPFMNGRGKFETMNGVGMRPFFTMSVSSDPAEFYDYVLSLIKQADENGYKEAVKAIDDVEKQMGLTFKDDILPALGTEHTVVITEPAFTFDSQFVPVPLAVIWEIRDKAKLEKVQKTLYTKFDRKPRIRQYGAHKIEELPYMVVCMTDKDLIVTSSLRTMEQVLDTMDGKTPKFVDSERFQAARKMLGEKAAVFMYVNSKDLMKGLGMGMRWAGVAMFMEQKRSGGMQPPQEPPAPWPSTEPAPGEEPGVEPMPGENPGPAEQAPAEPTKDENLGKLYEKLTILFDLVAEYFPDKYAAINGEADGLSIRGAAPSP